VSFRHSQVRTQDKGLNICHAQVLYLIHLCNQFFRLRCFVCACLDTFQVKLGKHPSNYDHTPNRCSLFLNRHPASAPSSSLPLFPLCYAVLFVLRFFVFSSLLPYFSASHFHSFASIITARISPLPTFCP